ncbi:hypothetical protein BsWGS_21541 [Bradybaena similaris]
MAKPGKKKDKPQKDEKQTKISSFFENLPDKKGESKLFTGIGDASVKGAERLTSVKERHQDLGKAKSTSKHRTADSVRGQSSKIKPTKRIDDDDDVVFVDAEEPVPCTDVESKLSSKIAIAGDGKSNKNSKFCGSLKTCEESGLHSNSNNVDYKYSKEYNLDSVSTKYGSDSSYLNKDEQYKKCSAYFSLEADALSFNNEDEPVKGAPFETSEASLKTPTKQALQASSCEASDSSPDVICETPDVDRVLGAASLKRRKTQSSRSFLCPRNLLGVQPGLKPAHLRLKNLRAASKLTGKVSISFTASLESPTKSEDTSSVKPSQLSDSVDVDIHTSGNSTVRNDRTGPTDSVGKEQINQTHVRPFQENLKKNIDMVKDEIAPKEKPEIAQPDIFCIPETQYVDVPNLQLNSSIDEDFEVDQTVDSNQVCQVNVQPQFQPREKHWSPRHKEAVEQYINDIDSVSFNDPVFRPNERMPSVSIMATPNTVINAGSVSNVNMFASKTSHFPRKPSDGGSKPAFETTKTRSKLINALETADSKAEITEENVWMGERLSKHFSEADFTQSVEGKLQTTPVKVYGEHKHVKRQAKPGLSPCSKRHLMNSFTDLKDPTQARVSSLNKDSWQDTLTKTRYLENLAVPDIQAAKGRLTENRAYQFGLKKKGNLENKKVTLENDKLLSELLGKLKSPSKAESRVTSHALKELNPFPKLAVDKERCIIGAFSKSSGMGKNSFVRSADNIKGVLQTDIEILHQLFGKDTSDSEELAKEVPTMEMDEHPVLQQGVCIDTKSSYTFPNNVITSNNSVQEDAIVILDDIQSMIVENSECFIVEDHPDNCLGSPVKMAESHKASESYKIPELINVFESRTIPESHESHDASHKITGTSRDDKQTAETLPFAVTCPAKDVPNTLLPVNSNVHRNEPDNSTQISSCNFISKDPGTAPLLKVIPKCDTSQSDLEYKPSERREQTIVANDAHIMVSASTIKQQINISKCTAENNRQFSGISPNSAFGNVDIYCDETVTATHSCGNHEGHLSMGIAAEGFVSAKNVSNMECGSFSSNHTGNTSVALSSKDTAIEVDNTELSASVCGMLSETFDEDFDDFDSPDMPNVEFKFTDLWNRFTVLDVVHDRVRNEIQLTLMCSRTRAVSHCVLRGFWTDTVVCKEDTVNIVGSFSSNVCIIDDKNGLIIVNPDLLLSGTLVVSSTFCARKSVLNEKFKGVDSGNVQMLYGSVIHSLFQSVLKDGVRDEKTILKMASALLRSNKFLHEMYSHGVQGGSVMEEIGQYIPALISWLKQHTPTPGRAGTAKLQESDVMIQEIHDIEENIWSPRFGLKGKIDVTVKARLKKPNQLEEVKVLPLELKTGKASFSHEHKGQVTLYSMMSSDRREDPEEGILLYLKQGQMETVPVKPQNKAGLIQLRNNLALYLKQGVRLEASETGQLAHQLGQLPPPINNQRACSSCAHLLNCSIYQRAVDHAVHPEKHAMSTLVPDALQHLTDVDLGYFTHWMLCVDIEEQESRKKQLSQIWRASSLERERNGECLRNLVIAGSELDIPETQCFTEGRGCSLTFTRDPSQPGTPLNAVGLVINDIVVISSEDGHYIALATGFVRRLSHHMVEVIVDRDYLHDTSAFVDLRFRLDKNESFSTSGYLCTNLSRLMESSPRATYLRDVIIKLRPPEFELQISKSYLQKVAGVLKPLNKQQRRAILKVLMSKDYVLIKGFPGTGKTATIVALVKIMHLIGQSVLLTSYTHSAVDNILLKLKESDIPFLRLGRRGRIHPLILPHSAEILTSSMTVNSVLDLKKFYDSYNVVATSALGMNHPMFKHRQFDLCIVDEASQVLQPACLGPLFHCRKFVLVGDPKQLPPVVQSREARNLGMDESLFARLDSTGATYDLCLQYRMNRVIMELSNSLVYEGKLQCGSSSVAEQCYQLNGSVLQNCPSWMVDALSCSLEGSVVFVDTGKISCAEVTDGKGVTNQTEAELVASLVRTLVKANVPEDEIGVISPYRSQVRLIKEKILGCGDVMNVEVNTVDQYQGRDKSIIAVSFVRSQGEGAGELLKDLRRLNVALTRARHKLILVGNAAALKSYKHIASILLRLEATENIIQVTEI